MNFSVIRIIPDGGIFRKVVEYRVEIDHGFPDDCVGEGPVKPVPTGYFYFPETMGVQEAFDTLKAEMIKHRLQMIENLTQEVLLINAVKLEDKNEKSK